MPSFPQRFLVRLPVLLGLGCVAVAGAAGAQTAPVADAGPDQAIPCAGPDGALVTLDGSASFDPDDPAAVLTFTWTGDALAAPVDGAMPSVQLPLGDHVLTLTVDDGVDAPATDDVMVQVSADTGMPELVLSGDSAELWPPNHKQHLFRAADFVASVSDDCDAELGVDDVVFDAVTSDEEDNGRGDGNTSDDVLLAYGCNAALVRAERQGSGNGRVYEATLAVHDAAGNAAQQVVTISVPKSRGHGDAIDSGDAYTVGSDTCAPVDLCPAVPAEDCLQADSGKLSMTSRGTRERMRWKARGFDAEASDLADGEDGTDYQVCIYVDDGTSAAMEGDPAAPAGRSWRSARSGQSYRARGAARSAGLQKVKLRSRGGETGVRVAGRGEGLELPALPVEDGAAVRIQLWNSDGVCMEATFDDPHVNRPGRYRAKLR